jgi:hypothetical protein
MSTTPLSSALKHLILALKDSAEAFVVNVHDLIIMFIESGSNDIERNKTCVINIVICVIVKIQKISHIQDIIDFFRHITYFLEMLGIKYEGTYLPSSLGTCEMGVNKLVSAIQARRYQVLAN